MLTQWKWTSAYLTQSNGRPFGPSPGLNHHVGKLGCFFFSGRACRSALVPFFWRRFRTQEKLILDNVSGSFRPRCTSQCLSHSFQRPTVFYAFSCASDVLMCMKVVLVLKAVQKALFGPVFYQICISVISGQHVPRGFWPCRTCLILGPPRSGKSTLHRAYCFPNKTISP